MAEIRLYAIFICFVLSSGINIVSCGMECRLPAGYSTCPRPTDRPEDEFCCETSDGAIYCCDSGEYVKTLGILIPILLIVVVAITATGCLCCLCCPCCLLYKRRHNGTVYGRVQGPPTTVVTVQQPAPPYPGIGSLPVTQAHGTPIPQPGIPGYPPPGYPDYGLMQGSLQQPPPPYNVATANEGYAKQAPYNPNY
ncbi:protein shisa-5 isoform X2 [Anabrus simplex]|uniref:protein shisa-5 isoform X2 n=1 Tax=Anabrus simplex TaxID=316456 RepID=UPI0034DCEAAE